MDLSKYLLLTALIALSMSTLINHKVLWQINYESANTVYATSIEALNDANDNAPEIKTYQLALNATID